MKKIVFQVFYSAFLNNKFPKNENGVLCIFVQWRGFFVVNKSWFHISFTLGDQHYMFSDFVLKTI